MSFFNAALLYLKGATEEEFAYFLAVTKLTTNFDRDIKPKVVRRFDFTTLSESFLSGTISPGDSGAPIFLNNHIAGIITKTIPGQPIGMCTNAELLIALLKYENVTTVTQGDEDKAVVRITGHGNWGKCYGTGVFVNHNTVLTANHIATMPAITIKDCKGNTFTIDTITSHATDDIAIITVFEKSSHSRCVAIEYGVGCEIGNPLGLAFVKGEVLISLPNNLGVLNYALNAETHFHHLGRFTSLRPSNERMLNLFGDPINKAIDNIVEKEFTPAMFRNIRQRKQIADTELVEVKVTGQENENEPRDWSRIHTEREYVLKNNVSIVPIINLTRSTNRRMAFIQFVNNIVTHRVSEDNMKNYILESMQTDINNTYGGHFECDYTFSSHVDANLHFDTMARHVTRSGIKAHYAIVMIESILLLKKEYTDNVMNVQYVREGDMIHITVGDTQMGYNHIWENYKSWINYPVYARDTLHNTICITEEVARVGNVVLLKMTRSNSMPCTPPCRKLFPVDSVIAFNRMIDQNGYAIEAVSITAEDILESAVSRNLTHDEMLPSDSVSTYNTMQNTLIISDGSIQKVACLSKDLETLEMTNVTIDAQSNLIQESINSSSREYREQCSRNKSIESSLVVSSVCSGMILLCYTRIISGSFNSRIGLAKMALFTTLTALNMCDFSYDKFRRVCNTAVVRPSQLFREMSVANAVVYTIVDLVSLYFSGTTFGSAIIRFIMHKLYNFAGKVCPSAPTENQKFQMAIAGTQDRESTIIKTRYVYVAENRDMLDREEVQGIDVGPIDITEKDFYTCVRKTATLLHSTTTIDFDAILNIQQNMNAIRPQDYIDEIVEYKNRPILHQGAILNNFVGSDEPTTYQSMKLRVDSLAFTKHKPFIPLLNIYFVEPAFEKAVYEYVAYVTIRRSEVLNYLDSEIMSSSSTFVKGPFFDGNLSQFVYIKGEGVKFIDDAPLYGYGDMYSHEDLAVFHDQHLLASLVNFSNAHHTCYVQEVIYNQGIVGSGKTRFIREYVKKEKALVLTQSKSAASELGAFARTITSYLINSNDKADILIVDEATMMHFGIIILAATKCGAKSVVCFGDHEQVSFINRTKAIATCHADIIYEKTRMAKHSHRCPQDVCNLLENNYGKITTSNKPVSSMTVHISPQPLAAAMTHPGVTVLTYTQKEKRELKNAMPGTEVLTVAEAEGITRPEIVLVRLNTSDIALNCGRMNRAGKMKLNPHQLVGVTRHTNKITIISPVKDFLCTAVLSVKCAICDNLFTMPTIPGNYIKQQGTIPYYGIQIANILQPRGHNKYTMSKGQYERKYKSEGHTEKVVDLKATHFGNRIMLTGKKHKFTKPNIWYNRKHKPVVEHQAATGKNNCWYDVTRYVWAISGITSATRARYVMGVPENTRLKFSQVIAAFEAGKDIEYNDCNTGDRNNVHLFVNNGVYCQNCVKFSISAVNNHVQQDINGSHVLCCGRSFTNSFNVFVGDQAQCQIK